MSAQDLEQRARELLAEEWKRDGHPAMAHALLNADLLSDKNPALRAIVAALRQQPAPVDLEQFRLAVAAFKVVATQAKQPDVIAEADRLLSIIDNAHQPAPVVDDARMARALEWVRGEREPGGEMVFPSQSVLAAIEEAIAAYDPNCGARTVRVVDDACNWRQQDEDGDHISTGCGHEFILNDAGDYEDGCQALPFCCYCAKPTLFRRWRDEPECSCDHSDGDAPECEGCADRRGRAALARAQGVQS